MENIYTSVVNSRWNLQKIYFQGFPTGNCPVFPPKTPASLRLWLAVRGTARVLIALSGRPLKTTTSTEDKHLSSFFPNSKSYSCLRIFRNKPRDSWSVNCSSGLLSSYWEVTEVTVLEKLTNQSFNLFRKCSE